MENDKPSQLGRYTVAGDLGEGAFSKVFLGRDDSLNRDVALKVMKSQEFVPRLKAEAMRLGQMTGDERFVQVYDIGTHYNGEEDGTGLDYLVLEKCDGTLRDEMAKRHLPNDYIEFTIQALDGLQRLHDEKIPHTDLKPENLFFQNKKVKIGDFSLVGDEELANFSESVAQSGITSDNAEKLLGTPKYMAPEQKRGMPAATTATNVYAMGQILTEAITGRTTGEIGFGSSFERFGAPKWLDSIVAKATAFEPEERYATPRAFANELSAGLAGKFDGPTTRERIVAGTKKTGEMAKDAAITGLNAVTFPFWGPKWFFEKADEYYLDEFKRAPLVIGGVVLALATYVAAPITGLVQYEKHREGQTRAVAEQVFAEQPNERHLFYQDNTGIKSLRLNEVLTDDRKPREYQVQGDLVGIIDNLVIAHKKGAYNSEDLHSYRHQLIGHNITTGETKDFIDYTNEGNAWLRDNHTFIPKIVTDAHGKNHLGFTDSLGELYVIDVNGNVWHDGISPYTVADTNQIVPGTNLRINHDCCEPFNIQTFQDGDWWGDLEMFNGTRPVVADITTQE